MKIVFLGVGGGESYPAMFCNCRLCAQFRAAGKVLGCASILIDDQFLFDAPPGTSLNLALFKITPKFPFHIFITHSHQDHFDPFETISPRDNTDNEIFLHLNRTTSLLLEHYRRFNRFYDLSSPQFTNFHLRTVVPFEEINVVENTGVIPVLAHHDQTNNEENLNYIIKRGNKTVLYACDTGWYDNERTWSEILKHRYDAVILECTFLSTEITDPTHMDYEHFLKFMEYLKEATCIDAGTKIIATHFSLHHYDFQKVERLRDAGVEIAHRGMVCEC